MAMQCGGRLESDCRITENDIVARIVVGELNLSELALGRIAKLFEVRQQVVEAYG